MKRSAAALIVVVVGLASGLWWFLLIAPINQRVAEVEDQIVQAQEEEGVLKAQKASLQLVEDNMLEYLAAIGELDTAITPTPATAALIDDLSVLADETGVTWNSGSYANPQQSDEGYYTISISLAVEGQFFEVLGYLYGIADMERLIRVESISLSPTQDENGFTVLNASIAATAFSEGSVSVLVAGEDGEPLATEPQPAEGDRPDQLEVQANAEGGG